MDKENNYSQPIPKYKELFSDLTPVWREIGVRIRKNREIKGYSKYELQELSGVSDSTISRYEAGENEPKISNLMLIGKGLGISYLELLPNDLMEEKQKEKKEKNEQTVRIEACIHIHVHR